MANRSRSSFSKTQKLSGDESKSPPNKNLAHVPCKFFKQGACQAGNSCPFSHQLDTTSDTTPCKYFQKGNCKFGAKCALAHILPDGRRVNPKTLAQVYQNHNVVNGSINGLSNHVDMQSGSSAAATGAGTSASLSSTSAATITPLKIINNGGASSTRNGFFGTRTMNATQSPTNSQFPLMQSPSSSYNNRTSGITTSGTTDTTSPPFGGFASRVGSISAAQNGFQMSDPVAVSPSHPRTFSSTEMAPFSNNNSIWSSPAEPSSSYQKRLYYRSVSHSAAVRPTYQSLSQSMTHENAIIDDGDENDGEMFEEDFVPSSLSDLLTPQELQRRGSRSSMSRPTLPFSQIKSSGVVWESQHTSTEAIVDSEENEMQFKMDEEFYDGNGSTRVSTAMTGLDMNGLKI